MNFDQILDTPPPLLAAAAVFAAVMVIGGFASTRFLKVLIGMMVFVSALSVSVNFYGMPIRIWLNPIQSMRSELFLALGALLGIAILGHTARLGERRVSKQGVLLFVMAIYASALRVVHEGPGDGVQSLVFACATILPLLLAVPLLIDDVDDVYGMLWLLVLVNAAWLGGVAIQYGIDPGALSKGRQGRFFGLLGNPQHAAVFLGVLGAITFWMFLNDPRTRRRPFYGVLLGANMVFLAWTGSRTGMAMFVIGVVVSVYGRFGRTILLLPAVFVVGLAGFWIANRLGIDLGSADRLLSTQDTRSASWQNMIQSGMRNPAIGVGISRAGDSENSYLYAFAAYGVGMIALIAVLLGTSALICLKLFRQRRHVAPQHRPIIDLVLGYNAMYFAGGVLEGYMMARVAASLVFLVVFGSIASRIIEMIAEGDPSLVGTDEDDAWAHVPDPDAPIGGGEWDEHWGDDESAGAYGTA